MDDNKVMKETSGLHGVLPTAKPKHQARRRWFVVLAGMLSMALVSVACGGATQTQPDQGAGNGVVASDATPAPATGNDAGSGPNGANNGGPRGGRFNFRETPAPELPTTQAAHVGLLVRRDGANLLVGTGFGQGQGQGQGRPQRTPGTSGANGTWRAPNSGTPFAYNGPTVEVVTNSNTKFYKDVTQMNFQPGDNNGGNNQSIQQQVQSVNSLDELLGSDASNGTMTVWGTKNGDQITASVVVYRPRQGPPVTPAPGG